MEMKNSMNGTTSELQKLFVNEGMGNARDKDCLFKKPIKINKYGQVHLADAVCEILDIVQGDSFAIWSEGSSIYMQENDLEKGFNMGTVFGTVQIEIARVRKNNYLTIPNSIWKSFDRERWVGAVLHIHKNHITELRLFVKSELPVTDKGRLSPTVNKCQQLFTENKNQVKSSVDTSEDNSKRHSKIYVLPTNKLK